MWVKLVFGITLMVTCQLVWASSSGDELASESSYGERLVESSFPFSTSFGRDAKEEANIYSSGINAILNSDGFLNQMETKFGGNDPKYTPNGPVEMAVHSKKTIEVIPVRFEEPKEGEPQVIEISPYEVPLSIVFKTQTNKINVNQEHKSEAADEVKETSSEEEPHRVVHNVYRPVIQEVTEVIQPYRKVLQKVEPVIEEMKTIISKAAPVDGSANIQQTSQGQSYGGPSKLNTEFIRFTPQSVDDLKSTRYGNNNNLGINIVPMAYGSELVKKATTMPASKSTHSSDVYSHSDKSEMSRRYGFSNHNNDKGESNTLQLSKEDESKQSNKDTDYNDIIKQYIGKLLEQKGVQSKQHGMQINPNSIKMFNVPMKNSPNTNSGKNPKSYKSEDKSPKFKIIKEFRISLDDIKKQLHQSNNKNTFKAKFPSSSSEIRPSSKMLARFESFKPITRPNMSMSMSSFAPRRVNPPNRVSDFRARTAAYGSPKRVGDSPLPSRRSPNRRSGDSGRNVFNRRPAPGPNKRPVSRALNGVSPPNILFGQESRVSNRSYQPIRQ